MPHCEMEAAGPQSAPNHPKTQSFSGLDIKGHRRTWPVCFSSPILCQPPSWAIFKPMATTSGGIEARCISYHFFLYFLKIPNIP